MSTENKVVKETLQQRATRLLTGELEKLCDRLEKDTHTDARQRLLLIQSIASAVFAATGLTEKPDWWRNLEALEVEHDRLVTSPPWTDGVDLPALAQPRHVYHCHERCPAYDGKRCVHLGYQAPCYHSSFPNICHVWLNAVVEKMGLTEEAEWTE
jgi:hypothetical protein